MPAPRRSSDLTILVAAGAATLVLSTVSVLLAPVETAPPVDGSSFGSHPAGGRAAFLALKAAGYDVQPSYEPLTSLRASPTETVLVIAEPALAPSKLDLGAVQAFVEAGGVVLATGGRASAFLPHGPGWRAGADLQEASVVKAAMPSPLSAGVPEIVMTPATTELPGGSPYDVIYGTQARPAVLAGRFGTGQAIWWAGSTPLTNAGISAPGHVELLVNAIGPPDDRTVIWDEHYHGHTRSFWSYIAGTPMPFAGVQVLVVFVGGMLAFSRRRWPIRQPYVERRASPLEFVDSMGALYQRAGTAAGGVATVRTRVRRILLSACGLPGSVSDEQLSRAAAGRVSLAGPELLEILEDSARVAADGGVSAEGARRMIGRLQVVGSALSSAWRSRI